MKNLKKFKNETILDESLASAVESLNSGDGEQKTLIISKLKSENSHLMKLIKMSNPHFITMMELQGLVKQKQYQSALHLIESLPHPIAQSSKIVFLLLSLDVLTKP